VAEIHLKLGSLSDFLGDLPWPESFFSSDDLPGFLSKVYVLRYNWQTSETEIHGAIDLAIDGQLDLNVPDFGCAGLFLGGADSGYSIISTSIVLSDHPVLTIDSLPITLRFDPNVLRPVAADGNVPPPFVEISTAGALTIDLATCDVDTDGLGSLRLEPCAIGDTDIVISADGVKLDLSRSASPPEVLAGGFDEAFVGLCIASANVRLPSYLKLPDLIATNCIIGDKGFSGELKADLARNPVITDVAGLDVTFTAVDLIIASNLPRGGYISGSLQIPGLYAREQPQGPCTLPFQIVLRDHECVVTTGTIPPLSLCGFDLDLDPLSLIVKDSGVEGSVGGKLCLGREPGQALDLDLTVKNGVWRIVGRDFGTITIADIEVEFDQFSIQLSDSGIQSSSGTGTLTVADLNDANDHPAKIGFSLLYADGVFTLSGNSFPEIAFGSITITLKHFTVAFDKDGIVGTKTDIQGTLTIPNPAMTLAVAIEIDNGFKITATCSPAQEVLLSDMLTCEVSRLGFGRQYSKWQFAFGGLLKANLSLPVLDRYLPSSIEIDDLSINDGVMDIRGVNVGWSGGKTIDAPELTQNEIFLPLNLDLGGMAKLQGIAVSPQTVNKDAVLDARFLGAEFKIGPFDAHADAFGLEMAIRTRDALNGNFGPFQVDLSLLSPKGVGVVLDTPIFSGGGYLMFDDVQKQYAGAIQLSIKGTFAITAIGLLTTKMPDGSQGTSLLLIITVQFPAPIPLSFNFYLAAVGGIAGLNRTANVDALRAGVQSDAIESALFPHDVLANITKIVSDLAQLFPPQRDQFLVGPMAMITWNTPPIVAVELGIIVEFTHPFRIALLGILKCALPTPDAALVMIQVNFLGVIDFDAEMISLDASLYASHILEFTLEGDMAVRLSWGAAKELLLSAGGFHPSYKPNALLHLPSNMHRMTVNFFTGNPTLVLKGYFAVTTNTIQFGALLDFHYSVSKFSAVAHFTFDVLFQFSPFYFQAQVSAQVAIMCGDTDLLAASLDFALQGPAPWIVNGTASFKILFWSYSISIHEQWGDQTPAPLPPIPVVPLLEDALNKSENWQAAVQPNLALQVILRNAQCTAGKILLPAGGTLSISQNVLPLGVKIDKFGNYSPEDITEAEIESVAFGILPPVDVVPVLSYFAPASFKTMTDDDKLRAQSYEPLQGGVSAGEVQAVDTPVCVVHPVIYDVTISDLIPQTASNQTRTMYARRPSNSRALFTGKIIGAAAFGVVSELGTVSLGKQPGSKSLFEGFVSGGAVGRNRLAQRKAREARYQKAATVKVREETYSVVLRDSLDLLPGTKHGMTRAKADDVLRGAINGGKGIQVVPDYLLNTS
jgi:hypothetical protein